MKIIFLGLITFFSVQFSFAQSSDDSIINNVKIKKLQMNSNQSDFGVTLFQNGILFSKSALSVSKLKNIKASSAKMRPQLYTSSTATNFADQSKFATYLKKKRNYGYATFHQKSKKIYYVVDYSSRKNRNKLSSHYIEVASFSFKKNKWVKAEVFPFNSKLYACTQPFVKDDGTRLYFSSNMPGGYGGMDIYYCDWKGAYWSTPVNMGAKVNTKGDEGHPFVDYLNNLYFSSNGREGFGGTDIYVFNLIENSSTPENLGEPFNSKAEDFAYMKYPNSDKGFFSSTRNNEVYDADIYSFERIVPLSKEIFITVNDERSNKRIDSVSMRLSLSDSKDTLNIILNNGIIENLKVRPRRVYEMQLSAKGYNTFTKNIYMNHTDSVYEFKLEKIVERCSVRGVITNKLNGKKILSAIVIAKNTEDENDTYTTISSIFGDYNFNSLMKNEFYEIAVSAVGYFHSNQVINTLDSNCFVGNFQNSNQYNFGLFSGKATKIDKVYFDLNKSELKEASKAELNKLVTMMKDNPKIIVELKSHTDSRGSDQLNLNLSQARSNACVAYIISQGIDKTRIVAKGYGETMLLNKCKDGVPCEERSHQNNRRTEFQVIGVRK